MPFIPWSMTGLFLFRYPFLFHDSGPFSDVATFYGYILYKITMPSLFYSHGNGALFKIMYQVTIVYLY